VRDVTEGNNADPDLQRLEAIIRNADHAIIGKTLDGVITSWNPAAERIFGYSSGEIIGKSIHMLSPKDRTGEICSILAKIKAGHPVEHLETIRIRRMRLNLPRRPEEKRIVNVERFGQKRRQRGQHGQHQHQIRMEHHPAADFIQPFFA